MNSNRYLMNEGWLFRRGEYELESLKDASSTCYASKSESGRGPAAYAFYDEGWSKVILPHDYVVSGQAEEEENAAHGYLHRGPAWYRRYFDLYPEDEGKRIKLIFEGIATNCTIWVNGHLMKRHFTGFEEFEIDATEVLKYGQAVNVISVRVDTQMYGNPTEAFEGWWYDGAGIYRNVWLEKVPNLHIERYGISVRTKEVQNGWETNTEVSLINEGYMAEEVEVKLTLIDQDKKNIVGQSQLINLKALEKETILFNMMLNDVMTWSLEHPTLYTAKVEIRKQGREVQVEEVKYGYRTISFNAQQGFLLNGQVVKIKGTANHQDQGALGCALTDNIMRWRIKILKEMGCNAYRCAHNTVTSALLEACDEMGMLVMSENRWFASSEENINRLIRMIKREKNHPSIIAWSVGNEEPSQCEKEGRRIAAKLIRTIKNLDESRPCTLAMNGGFFEKEAIQECDIIGVNYFPWLYDEIHEMYPDKVIIATEASCSNNCRGIYEQDEKMNRFTAYDKHAPSFGNTHREAWKYIDQRKFVAGVFYWSGFEYRGETKWPSLFSEVGMLDSNGFKKDNFYLMQALWKQEPMVHILPHWSWPDEKKQIEVWVYSNCEIIELFLNNKSLGEKQINPYEQGKWFVDYEPGELKAIGKRQGKIVSEEQIQTCGRAEKLNLELVNTEIKANGEEIAMIAVSVLDYKGNKIPYADNKVQLSFSGDCEYLGSGASPTDPTPVINTVRNLYSGLMQIYIRVGRTGKCLIKADSEGLETGRLELAIKPELGRPYIKEGKSELVIKRWWSSTVFETARNPENFKHRMPAEPGQPIPLFSIKPGYAMLSVVTNVPYYPENKRVSLYFGEIAGKAEIWVRRRNCEHHFDGQLDMMKENGAKKAQTEFPCSFNCPEPCEVYYKKANTSTESVILDLPKKLFKPDETITIWVGIKGDHKGNGITGLVKWMILEEKPIEEDLYGN